MIDKDKVETDFNRLLASIEDGSLRAEIDAKMDPEWNAKYGDAAWDNALILIGYEPSPDAAQTPVPPPDTSGGRLMSETGAHE